MVDVLRYRTDEAVGDPGVTVDSFANQTNASAVRLEPGDDARALLPYLDRLALVEVNFPAYGDGRAVGDVLIDQLSHMHRCGFDAFAPDHAISKEAADKAITTWPEVYQRTVDGRTPIWALRHG